MVYKYKLYRCEMFIALESFIIIAYWFGYGFGVFDILRIDGRLMT